MPGLLRVVAPAGGGDSVVRHVLRGLPTSSLDVGSLVGDRRSSLGCRFDCSQHSTTLISSFFKPFQTFEIELFFKLLIQTLFKTLQSFSKFSKHFENF
jgi:hypothetical protein